MEKTPIMILQETMVKKNVVPDYQVILSEIGTHRNTFTYRVRCKNLTADGTASNKKAAKHEAASAMLELLKTKSIDSDIITVSPVLQSSRISNTSVEKNTATEEQEPPPKIPADNFVNYIGKLQELCVSQKYPNPVFHEPVIIGPPHKPQFRIKCSVFTFEGEAAGASKQQTKHLAAQKVYRLLLKQQGLKESTLDSIDVVSTIPNVCSLLGELQITPKSDYKSLTEKAVAQYKRLNSQLFVPVNDYTYISKNHLQLKSAYYSKVTIEQIEDLQKMIMLNSNGIYPIVEVVKIIEDLFSLNIEQIAIHSKSVYKMFGFQINFNIVVTEIAVATTLMEAQAKAIRQLVKTLLVMMK